MGKRRMAREMAMQMLFQSDLGATPVALVVKSFDPVEYVAQLDREEREVREAAEAFSAIESGGTPPRARKRPAVAKQSPAEPREDLKSAFDYASRLASGVEKNLPAIDARIRAQADNWRLERMPSVDRNILRIAIYELEHETDVPKLVVVDEAVELAKRYGSEQSGRFINGLLDGLLKRGDFAGSRE